MLSEKYNIKRKKVKINQLPFSFDKLLRLFHFTVAFNRNGETLKQEIIRMVVPPLKSPTISAYITVAIVETTHFESYTSAITILSVLVQIKNPPVFLLKHHV